MIDKYEVTKDIILIRDDNVETTYPEDTVIFNIQAFKMSGKYYTSIRLILEGITAKDIQDWKEHPTEDKNSYAMFNNIIDFIKHKRPFFRDMDLVINCDSFYPVMIHGIKELDIPKVLKPKDVKENDATFKQPCELWGECKYYENGYCWMYEIGVEFILEECKHYETEGIDSN